MDIAKADFIEGMAKGMAVLESFDTERQRLNATLAAQRAGITRAAARRHLLTLAHLGYLESEDGYYWLSPKVLRFSGSYLASARLPRVLQPTLNRLAAQTQQSFSAVVLDADQVVIVARSVGSGSSYPDKPQPAAPRVLAYGLHLGARLPAHATSTGRMLLACLPRDGFSSWMKARELPRLTPHTVTDGRPLRALVAQARKQDYCVAMQEHELGVFALAVPLRNMRGATVAALNVVTAQERLEPAAMQRDLLPLLLDAARELRPLL
ncbi:IclR family transcriptional regulator domain-containing protein [Polaromonas sp.]|uniref:IclR family transcriptional regulator domain-containing protein n=1 Tax=Polaromonas sp. TaxID=1869339 RepID=UPI003BABBE06